MLYYMAFVFAGKGIADLQEAGLVKTTVLEWAPRIPVLGIYPTLQSLSLQFLLPRCCWSPSCGCSGSVSQTGGSAAGRHFPERHFTTPASYATFPPTIVSTLSVCESSPSGTVKMSCDKTARSASMPGASVPFSRSANSAYAEPRV